MSDGNSVIDSIISTLTGGIVNAFLTRIGNVVDKSPNIIKIRDALAGTDNQDVRRILNEAIAVAWDRDLVSKRTLEAVLTHPKNAELILSWILSDPESIDRPQPDQFAVDEVLTDYAEKEYVERFILALRTNIDQRKLQYMSVSEQISIGQNRSILSNMAVIKEMIENLDGPKHDADKRQPNDEVREARALFDARRYHDARRVAQKYLEQSGNHTDREPSTIEMLRVIVDSLIRQERKKEAIPYLERLIESTDDGVAKLRRQVLLAYINGDLQQAMSLAGELIGRPDIGDPELLLAAEIAANSGECETAMTMLKNISSESKEKAVVIESHCLAVAGEIDSAIDLLDQFLSNSSLDSSVREHSLRLRVIRFEKEVLSKPSPDSDTVAYAEKLVSDIEAFTASLSEDDISKHIDATILRASVLAIVRKYRDAYRLLEPVLYDKDLQPEHLLPASRISLAANELETSERLLRRAIDACDWNEAKFLLATVLLGENFPDEVIGLADQILESEKDDIMLAQAFSVKIAACDQAFRTSEAERLLDDMESTLPGQAERIALARARHFRLVSGRIDDSKDSYAMARKSSEPDVRMQASIELAELYQAIGDLESFQIASDILSEYATPLVADDVIDAYISCLVKALRIDQAMDVSASVIANHGYVESAYAAIAQAYVQQNELQEAIRYLEPLSQANRKNLTYSTTLAACRFRLGQFSSAVDILVQTESRAENAQDFMLVAEAYLSIGQNKNAVVAAYSALEIDTKNPIVHQFYIRTCMLAGSDLGEAGEKYIAAYQDSLQGYESRFPDNQFIQAIKIPQDPDQMIKVLNETMGGLSGIRPDAFDLYKEKRLPVAFLSKAYSRDLVTTWVTVTSQREIPLWNSDGNTTETTEERRISSHSRVVLIDPITYLLAAESQTVLAALQDFDEVLVCQSIVDHVIAARPNLLRPEQGYLSPTLNGGVEFQPADPHQIERRQSIAAAAIELLNNKNNLRAVGDTDSKDTTQWSELASALGHESADSIFEAKLRQIPLVSVDWSIRAFSRQLGAASIGIQPLLTTKTSVIGSEAVFEVLTLLIGWGASFVSVSVEALRIATMRDVEGRSSTSDIAILKPLRRPQTNEDSIVRVAGDYLAWLWSTSFLPETQQRWTDQLLFACTDGRHHRAVATRILNWAQQSISHLNIIAKIRLKDSVEEWLASQ